MSGLQQGAGVVATYVNTARHVALSMYFWNPVHHLIRTAERSHENVVLLISCKVHVQGTCRADCTSLSLKPYPLRCACKLDGAEEDHHLPSPGSGHRWCGTTGRGRRRGVTGPWSQGCDLHQPLRPGPLLRRGKRRFVANLPITCPSLCPCWSPKMRSIS